MDLAWRKKMSFHISDISSYNNVQLLSVRWMMAVTDIIEINSEIEER